MRANDKATVPDMTGYPAAFLTKDLCSHGVIPVTHDPDQSVRMEMKGQGLGFQTVLALKS